MNARTEFIEEVGRRDVLCAYIRIVTAPRGVDKRYRAQLNIHHSLAEYDRFLSKIDVEYNNGFGGQELEGCIWYTDGSWSERGEYDGSEWWEFKFRPTIPDQLRGK